MRRILLSALLGLAPTLVLASELTATGGAPGKAPQPAPAAKPAEEGATCGDFGTSVDFVDTPREAAQLAKKQGKLVCVLHISGNFEDPRFT